MLGFCGLAARNCFEPQRIPSSHTSFTTSSYHFNNSQAISSLGRGKHERCHAAKDSISPLSTASKSECEKGWADCSGAVRPVYAQRTTLK